MPERKLIRSFTKSLFFNGSSTRIRNTATVTGMGSACSVSVWFMPKNGVSATIDVISNIGIDTNTRFGITLQTGLLRAGYYNGSGYTSKNSDSTLSSGIWYHAVATWNGTATNLYINGVLQSGTGNNPNTGSAGGSNLGSNTGGSNCFNGHMDEFMVFTRALSASEAMSLYLKGYVSDTSLWLKWLLNEGSGTSATDSSGNSRNGTITDGTYTDVNVLSARVSS